MKEQAVIVGVAIALAVGVGALIVYGIATHSEPGLHPDLPRWERSQFPLRILGSTYSAEGARPMRHRGLVVDSVMRDVNAQLGFEAFTWADDGMNYQVEIVLGVPRDATWADAGGDAIVVSRQGRAERCHVRTSNTGTDAMLGLVLAHELGHCLGLDHDDYDASIMRPVQRQVVDLAALPRFSDFDTGLIRSRYGPRPETP